MADDLFGDSDSSGSQDTYDLIASAKVQPVTVKNKKDRTPKMIATKNKENGDDSSVAGLNDSDKANSSKKDDAHSSKKKAAKKDDNNDSPLEAGSDSIEDAASSVASPSDSIDDTRSSKKQAAKEDDNIATPAKKYAAKGYVEFDDKHSESSANPLIFWYLDFYSANQGSFESMKKNIMHLGVAVEGVALESDEWSVQRRVRNKGKSGEQSLFLNKNTKESFYGHHRWLGALLQGTVTEDLKKDMSPADQSVLDRMFVFFIELEKSVDVESQGEPGEPVQKRMSTPSPKVKVPRKKRLTEKQQLIEMNEKLTRVEDELRQMKDELAQVRAGNLEKDAEIAQLHAKCDEK